MRRITENSSSFWIRVFGIISLLFFAIVLGIKCISPLVFFPFGYSVIIYALIIASLILLFCFRKSINTVVNSIINAIEKDSRLKIVGIIFFVAFIPKLICGILWGIDSRNVNIDIYIYQNIAKELSTKGMVTTYSEYCNTYPYLLWFGFFLVPVVKIFGNNQTALCIFFDLLLSISSVLLYDTFSKTLSKTKVFIAVVLYSLLPSTVLLPQFIIHEIPYLFFLSLSIWIYFTKISKLEKIKQRIPFIVLFLLIITFATMINACGIIACLAIALNLIFFKNNPKLILRLFKGVSLIILVLLIQCGSSYFVKPLFINNNNLSTPKFNVIQWTLFVGGNVDSNGGFSKEDQSKFAWSLDDFNTLNEEGWTDEEVIAQRTEYFNERMNSLIQNPLTTLKLFFTKLGKIWSFFNYTYYALPPLITDSTFQYFYSEWLMPTLIMTEIAISIIVLILSISSIRKSNYLKCGIYRFSVLYLIGCTILFLIIECNSKYTISMQPFFWIIVIINMKKPKFFDSVYNMAI